MDKDEEADLVTGLGRRLGMRYLTLGAEKTIVSMPVAGNTQVFGVLHGGATAALCETAASAAALLHARTLSVPGRKENKDEETGRKEAQPPDSLPTSSTVEEIIAVGTEMSISHLRPATGAEVIATATAEHLGRTRTVHAVRVNDERGRLIATALVTNALVEKKPR